MRAIDMTHYLMQSGPRYKKEFLLCGTLPLFICLPGQEGLHQSYRGVKLLHHSDHSEPVLQVEHCQLQCSPACWVAALYAEEECQRRSLEEPFCIKKMI